MRLSRSLGATLLVLASIPLAACMQDFEQFRGGSGGAGGTGGQGGQGGNDPCAGVDCDDDNPCTMDTCNDAGQCEHSPSMGVVTVPQTTGDCKEARCDGDTLVQDPDPMDPPADAGPCETGACNGDMPAQTPKPADTMCNGTGVCDGMGNCSSCNTPAQCGMDAACGARTCVANTCGWSYTAEGTIVSDPTDGDCKAMRCPPAPANMTDAPGDPTEQADDTDLPANTANDCVNPTCSNGTVGSMNENNGTACDDGASPAGGQCQGGMCRDCTSAAGCATPATDVCLMNMCCVPESLMMACTGLECGQTTNNCGQTVTCGGAMPCANDIDGTACVSMQNVCGCNGDGDCASSPKGNDCRPTNACGCANPSDCDGVADWGADCTGGVCGCDAASDCSGNTVFGKDCIMNKCGCDGDSDCTGVGNGTCNMATNVCNP